MLIDSVPFIMDDPITEIMCQVMNRENFCKKLKKGFYEIPHFNFHTMIESKEQWPDFDQYSNDKNNDDYLNSYGVCDSPEQFEKVFHFLEKDKRNFVVSFTRVDKKDSSSN